MKIIYSTLKKFLPNLTVDPKQLRDDLTMIGHFVSGYEEIENETVLDLEIRQNRVDCLGYYGIARDLSVFYDIELVIPSYTLDYPSSTPPAIEIKSPDVKRIQAVKISGVKIAPSPEWLQKTLRLHDINSINNLVDITNLAMLMFSIPCHAFDVRKSSDNMIWENNKGRFKEFTSLDGTNLSLEPETLIISKPEEVLSLGFIGGQNSGIDNDTTETLIEMAVYNPHRIRTDSRHLKTITEASIRLDKQLDTETIPIGFNYLAGLIMEICGGQFSSGMFEVYNPSTPTQPIDFDPQKPSQYAGINIPVEYSTKCLNKLGCQKVGQQYLPPSIRKDIVIEEDLIEEVIRFYGYNKIPLNEPISSEKMPDITPKILYLAEQYKDDLAKLGYDEVRSWPLVTTPLDKSTAIYTQNSINSEYPVLRQSIIQSLQEQLIQYQKLKLPQPQFFEIGKVFSLGQDGTYQEKYALGIYHFSSEQLTKDIDKIKLPSAGLNGNYYEVILDDLAMPEFYQPSSNHNQAIELTTQMISLDANVETPTEISPAKLIEIYQTKIDPNILWQIELIDTFRQNTGVYRHTLRATYFNCDDKLAKSTHLQAFDLNK